MDCPYCASRLAAQGNIWIVAGIARVAALCYNEDCKSYGKPIIFKLMESDNDQSGTVDRGRI
jgi:hypothetical protein